MIWVSFSLGEGVRYMYCVLQMICINYIYSQGVPSEKMCSADGIGLLFSEKLAS